MSRNEAEDYGYESHVRTILAPVSFVNPLDPAHPVTVQIPLPVPPSTSLYYNIGKPIEGELKTALRDVLEKEGTKPLPRDRSSMLPDSSLNMSAREKKMLLVRSMDPSRHTWVDRVRNIHPEVLDVETRVHAVLRTIVFASLYTPGLPQVKECLSNTHILQLIMQHLQAVGLRQSLEKLESESGVSRVHSSLEGSRLVEILRSAMDKVDELYHLLIEGRSLTGKPEDCEARVRELLTEMGLKITESFSEPDVSIWDDLDDEHSLVENPEDHSIRAATLNKLVERLTIEKAPEGFDLGQYTKTFLMTYQSFTTPDKLLAKLMERFEVPVPDDVPEEELQRWHDTVRHPIQLRVVNVLRTWMISGFQQFNDKMINKIRGFIDYTLSSKSQDMAKMLTATLQKKMDLQKRQHTLHFQHNTPPPDPIVDLNTIFSPTLTWMMLHDEEIARQLTIVDFCDYSAIEPSELLDQAWNKPKLRHRAPNLLRLINRSTQLSMWVVECILAERRLRNRARMMEKFYRIAENLLKLHNFSALMGIHSGFQNSAIHRLNITRAEMPRAIQEFADTMDSLLTADSNYRVLRQRLSDARPPKIPFVGVYLSDLTFIDQANQDTCIVRYKPKADPEDLKRRQELQSLNDAGASDVVTESEENTVELEKSLVNFSKHEMVANVIKKIQLYQQTPYNLQPVRQISTLLKKTMPKLSSSDEKRQAELFNMSLKIEPRNCTKADIEI